MPLTDATASSISVFLYWLTPHRPGVESAQNVPSVFSQERERRQRTSDVPLHTRVRAPQDFSF